MYYHHFAMMCAPGTAIDCLQRPAIADPHIGQTRIDKYIMFVERFYLAIGSMLLGYKDQ
jgi:hypothetical protein